MRDVFLCDAARTAIGRYGGALSKVRTDDLAAVPIRALVKRNPNIDWSALDEVIFGCANQAGEDNRNVARMALLLAGLPESVPGITVNRLCASGLNAVGDAARAIRAGEIEFAIAGGVESMTRAPFVMGKAQEAFARQADVFDTTIGWRFINPLMKKQYGVDSMPETGENVAEDYQVKRADQDLFALALAAARRQGAGRGLFRRGDHPGRSAPARRRARSPCSTRTSIPRRHHAGSLAKLKTPFRENGTVTAGNASGVNDGAAAMILASEAAVKKHGLTPRARILGMAVGRRAAAHHGHRPGAVDAQADGEARPEDHRFRCDRTERSVRLAGAWL